MRSFGALAQAAIGAELRGPALRLGWLDSPRSPDLLGAQVAAMDLPLNGVAGGASEHGGLGRGEHGIMVSGLHSRAQLLYGCSMKGNQVRATGRQSGFEPRPFTSRGEAGAPGASQVRTRGTAGEAGRGDRDRNPGAGRLAPRPAHTTQDAEQ